MASSNSNTFVAIDFETANVYRNSACAIGLVRVERGRISRRHFELLRPPTRRFDFTYLHGITWPMVAKQPTFREAWPRLREFMEGAQFLAAHNAPFDRSVLRACCDWSGIEPPSLSFECTLRLARQAWRLPSARLDCVAAFLGLALRHHDAASDAEACAEIVLAAQRSLRTSTSGTQRPRRR